MPKSTIFGTPTFILSSFDDITIDAVLINNHLYPSLVTKNPTESGQNITDNIVLLPIMIELEGRITDTPVLTALGTGAGLAAGTAAQFGAVAGQIAGGIATAVNVGTSIADGTFKPGRSITVFKSILALRNQRRVFTVVTGLDVFENMTFELLSQPTVARDGRSVRFSATLMQVLVVNSLSVPIANVAAAVNHGAAPANMGTQPTPSYP